MSATFRLAKLITINIAILFLLVESLGLAIYYLEHQKLKYFDEPKAKSLSNSNEVEASSSSRLHPYLGYLNFAPHTALGHYKINNYGFKTFGTNYPFPKIKDREQYYIVAIFGGSVADQVFSNSKQSIKSELAKLPQLRDKEIHVLNFAQPGYKQPQQLQLLTYFLSIGQQFDLIINLDGFNEVVLGAANLQRDLALSMPSYGHMLPMMDLMNQSLLGPEKLQRLARITKYKEQLTALRDHLNKAKLGSTHLILTLLTRNAQKQYSEALLAYDQLPYNPHTQNAFHLNQADGKYEIKAAVNRAADYWRDSSILMNKIAQANDIQYFHIIQPNQYFSRRDFSDQEARIAIDPDHIYRQAAIDGYPELTKRFIQLKDNGVMFADGLAIVDDEVEPVYADSCCHFTPRGTELIADFIVQNVIAMELVQ
jgi:hypothetical protein